MNQPATVPEAAATTGPRELGAQMAKLREQFGLSHQEVSERLHIRMRYVSAIEEGRYDLMPGKVYARGYVHTYAEFLGLNPEEVVAQCFAGEAPANAQPLPSIAAARYATPQMRTGISPSRSGPWRGLVLLAALALVGVLVVSQFMDRGGDTPKQDDAATVAPPPEAMLESVRTMVMPLSNNYECLTSDDAYLTCFTSDDATYLLDHLDSGRFWYGGKVDVTTPPAVPEAAAAAEEAPAAPVDEAPAVAEDKPAADKPTTDDPDSPPVVTAPAKEDVVDDGQNLTPPHDE